MSEVIDQSRLTSSAVNSKTSCPSLLYWKRNSVHSGSKVGIPTALYPRTNFRLSICANSPWRSVKDCIGSSWRVLGESSA